MFTTRLFGTAVVVAAVACSTVLSLGGVSAAQTHTAHTPAPPPKAGTYIAHEPIVSPSTKASAYAVDRANYEHLVQFRHTGPGTKGRIMYYSRKLKAKSWNEHFAPGSFDLSGHPRLEITQDWQLEREYVVVYTCSGDYAASFGPTAARLPAFTQVSSVSDCRGTAAPQQRSATWVDYADNSSLLHVIVPDATTIGQWDLRTGEPGKPFAQVATVPADDRFVPTQLAGSRYNGGEVIGQGIDSNGHRAVYETQVTTGYNETTSTYYDAFGDLTRLGGLGSATRDYLIESVSWASPLLDVALYQPAGSRAGQKYTLFMDERDSSGQWTTPIPVPRTTIHDRALILTTSPTTGKLRATWERSIGTSKAAKRSKSGIITQRRLSTNHWEQSVWESHWWQDTPLSVSYDNTGLPHFLYVQKG